MSALQHDSGIPRRRGKGAIAAEGLSWLFRGALALTSFAHLLRGEPLYALLAGAALGLAAAMWRLRLSGYLELLFLWLLTADATLGRLCGLYESSGWFDKGQHLGNSVLLGLMLFLGSDSLRRAGRLRLPARLNAGALILLVLGLGALWEIAEYAADQVFQRGAQGSPGVRPLDDTMWDLILDGAGGALGALLGPRALGRLARQRHPRR